MTAFQKLLKRLGSKLDLSDLLKIWNNRDSQVWNRHLRLYQRLGHRLIKMDHPLFGLDVLTEGLTHQPTNKRLRQLQALAFAGCGATDRARCILAKLKREGYQDGDTFGIWARTYKDSWRRTGSRTDLRVSHSIYLAGYRRAARASKHDDAFYNAINAASTALWLNDRLKATRFARLARKHCDKKRKLDYYGEATLGEAALLLDDIPSAMEHYRRAKSMGGKDDRDLVSTRRQAREILRHRGQDPSLLDECFEIGPVIVFAGHMIDTPQRLETKEERFPKRYEAPVKAALSRLIQKLKPHVSYSSAACGSDILFLEAMREDARKTCIVLPFSRKEFAKTSVQIASGWEQRYRWSLRSARRNGGIDEVSEQALVLRSASYEYANLVLQGMATIQAERLDAEIIGVAVWDGKPGDGAGGTSSIIANWWGKLSQIEAIRPSGETLEIHRPPRRIKPKGDTRIMAVLFADVKHFSQLTEAQLPVFRDEFLELVGTVSKTLGTTKLKNTWGDGLFFAFSDVREAGHFALELQKAIRKKRWKDYGLPAGLGIRIGLHAGPVYRCRNPITGRIDYLGTHVNRGARIEPKTATGRIYCSQQFAALARARGVNDFVFEYVGMIELPKQNGVIPLYDLRADRHSR